MLPARASQTPFSRGPLLLLLLALVACGTSKKAGAPDAGTSSSSDFITEPNLFAIAGEAYRYASRVSVPAEAQANYELIAAPTGMSIDPVLGDILWNPSASEGGSHSITIQASIDATVLSQHYVLQVGVPRLAAEEVITEAGGQLSAGDLVVTIPPGAVDAPTGFSLWILEEGLPPLWDEMHLIGLPFVLRSSGSMSRVPAVITTRADLPKDALGYLAHGTSESAGKKSAGDVEVVVVNETASGPSSEQISADLTAVSAEYVDLTATWLAFTYLFAELYDGEGFRVVWAYNELALDDVSGLASEILSAFADAKATATGSMGCDVQDELVIYVASFKTSTSAVGIAWDQKVFLNKRAVRESSTLATRDTIAHEYFHTIQGHILAGADSGWIAEPTAEFAAGQIFNANLSHKSFGVMDDQLSLLGFAEDSAAAVDLHQYQLYIYFRYLRETTSWRVCDFYKSQSTALSTPTGAYTAMSAHLGSLDFPQSYLDFTEAYLFARDSASFGDDAAGIGDWEPATLDFNSEEVMHGWTNLHGGAGLKINRASTETQHIAVELLGSLFEGTSLPLGVVRDASGAELASLVGIDQKAVLLKDVNSSSFTITAVQGLMDAHPNAKTLTIKVSEFDLVVENVSGSTTDENGVSVSFDLRLTASPGDQTFVFDVASSDTSEGSVDKSSLTFTKDDWDQPQTVTVTGQNDNVVDGDVDYSIDVQVASPANWNLGSTIDLVNVEPLPIVTFDISTIAKIYEVPIERVSKATYLDGANWSRPRLNIGSVTIDGTGVSPTVHLRTLTGTGWTAELSSSYTYTRDHDYNYTGGAALPYSLVQTKVDSSSQTLEIKVNSILYGSVSFDNQVSRDGMATSIGQSYPLTSLSGSGNSSTHRITRVVASRVDLLQEIRIYVTDYDNSHVLNLLSSGQDIEIAEDITATSYEIVLRSDSAGNVTQTTENTLTETSTASSEVNVEQELFLLFPGRSNGDVDGDSVTGLEIDATLSYPQGAQAHAP